MADLHHECGIAAVCLLNSHPDDPELDLSGTTVETPPQSVAHYIPRMLLEIQNRGQLAAGISSFSRHRAKPFESHLIRTHKKLGTVNEAFKLNRKDKFQRLMSDFQGTAAIGHVRYATCGQDDVSMAQPFERYHLEKRKWFSFAFNGNIANFRDLWNEICTKHPEYHLARETDTEVLMHLIAQELAGERRPTFTQMLERLTKKCDGAFNIVYLNASGDMVVARDPYGFRPLCYAVEGNVFAAASESVALDKAGFSLDNIRSLEPGHAIIIQNGRMRIEQFAKAPRTARCFFEWIYFANVGSTLDDRNVYLSRKRLGAELARLEAFASNEEKANTIVVAVPDTAKAAADSMAYELGLPALEGLIRNRYVGRTFIEGKADRADKVRSKFTLLREVLQNKRVILVEDSIVRSTTLQTLIKQIRERGGAKEIHVRVACPPIVSPCFYGIDMSSVKELFAPRYLEHGVKLTPETESAMAKKLDADSLHYLPLEALARCVGFEPDELCQACLTSEYPTPKGQELYQIDLDNSKLAMDGSVPRTDTRTYELALPVGAVQN